MPLRFHVVSDLHVDAGGYVLPAVKRDAVIVAGDVANGPRRTGVALAHLRKQVDRADGVPIYYVPGNHDWYGADLEERKDHVTFWRSAGVQVLDARTALLGKVRLIGCTWWSAMDWSPSGERGPAVQTRNTVLVGEAISDYRWIREDGRPIVPETTIQLHEQETEFIRHAVAAAIRHEETPVVITHFVPTRSSVHARWVNDPITPYFANDAPALSEGVRLWICGHTHSSIDHVLPETGCRVVCNPHGYGPENPNHDPQLVVEVS